MAHFHVKTKKGRPYLYVRGIARAGGKPKVVSQIYIGSPERVASLAAGLGDGAVKLKVEEYGALWLAGQIDRDVDLVRIVDEVVPWGDREEGPSVGNISCIASGTGCASRPARTDSLNGMKGQRYNRFVPLILENSQARSIGRSGTG